MDEDFICALLAELLDYPCNMIEIEEELEGDAWCLKNCGRARREKCWFHYLRKRWEARE